MDLQSDTWGGGGLLQLTGTLQQKDASS